MRKVLLFATALCLSSAAMAQTSIESALDAQKGENTYKVGSSEAKNTYWKFTSCGAIFISHIGTVLSVL